MPMVSSYIPWKHHKIKPESIQREWHEMYQKASEIFPSSGIFQNLYLENKSGCL